MKQAFSSPLAATAVVLSLLLAGCAAPPSPPARSSYVVLLPSPDGSVGQVVVQGQSGQHQRSHQGRAHGSCPFVVEVNQRDRM